MQRDGWIDMLIASRHNLGKIGAFEWILAQCRMRSSATQIRMCSSARDGRRTVSRFWNHFPVWELSLRSPVLMIFCGAAEKHILALENDPRFQSQSRNLDASILDEYAAGVGLDPERLKIIKDTPSRLNHETARME